MLPEFLDQIPPGQNIGSVTADRAYDTRKCHEAIAARSALTVIPPRKNAKPWKPTRPVPTPETRPSMRSYTWAALCGDGGADTIAEAVSKRNLSSFASKRLPVSGCIV